MKKTKRNKTVLFCLSIASMLTLVVGAPTLIHESSLGEDSNISAGTYTERAGNDFTFSGERANQSKNSVTYDFSYAEDDVYYWDQKIEDFKAPDWRQVYYDDWKYETIPTFTIRYTGSASDYEKPNFGYTWKLINNDEENRILTYEWGSTYTEASEPGIDTTNWEVISSDEGEWIQYSFDEWDWNYKYGSWDDPVRTETGNGNEREWIEWELSSKGNVEKSGELEFSPNQVDVPSKEINDDSIIEFVSTEEERKHETAPTWSFPVGYEGPNDSESWGVKDSEELTIDGLAYGWEYNLSAKFMYVDEYGNEKQYDQVFNDTFKLNKDEPTTYINLSNEDSNTITANYVIDDPMATRHTKVHWELIESENVIYEGDSNEDEFQRTFDNLDPEKEYKFKINYDYVTFEDDNGEIELKSFSDWKTISPTGNYYNNVITITDFWLSNEEENSFVANVDIDTNNNEMNNNLFVEYRFGNQVVYLDELKPGTNSVKIYNSNPTISKNINLISNIKIDSDVETTLKPEMTNMVPTYTIYLKDGEYTNHEAIINYAVDGNSDAIENLEYQLNDGDWVTINDGLSTTGEHQLYLENLIPLENYTITFRSHDKVEDVYIFSNTFKFEMDRNPSLSESSEGIKTTDSMLSFSYEVDKVEYLDDKNVYWELYDNSKQKYVQNGVQAIYSNGVNRITVEDLDPDNEYILTMNLNYKDNVYVLNLESWTDSKIVQHSETTGNIVDINTDNGEVFDIEIEGAFKYISYFNESTSEYEKINYSREDNILRVRPTNVQTSYTFIINGSISTAKTWYSSLEGTLIKDEDFIVEPDEPFKMPLWVWVLLPSLIFAILIITLISIWAYWWHKKRDQEKSKFNIWG